MADLYMQMCMKCQIVQDCYAYEDGYICMECFDVEMAKWDAANEPPYPEPEMTIDLDTFKTFFT